MKRTFLLCLLMAGSRLIYAQPLVDSALRYNMPAMQFGEAKTAKGVSKRISLGGYIGISKISVTGLNEIGNTISGTVSYFIIGARGIYYFKFIKHLDPYVGVLVSYNIGSADLPEGFSQTMQGFVPAGFIGCRYMFTKYTGVFAELGYGVAVMTTGLNISFH